MTFEEAALAEPCSVAYYSIYGRDGFVSGTDDCVIFGAGVIGLFASTICKAAGAKVLLVEPLEFRRNLAKEVVGADAVIDPAAEDVKEAVLRHTNGRGATFVVECTGKDPAVKLTIPITRAHARIRYIGHSVGRDIPIPVGEVIWKGLNLQGSAGSPFFIPKTLTFMERVKERIDFSRFITQRFGLEDIHEAFDTAVKHKDEAIKVMLTIN
jgi:L-iditol 2-dehydrogenase